MLVNEQAKGRSRTETTTVHSPHRTSRTRKFAEDSLHTGDLHSQGNHQPDLHRVLAWKNCLISLPSGTSPWWLAKQKTDWKLTVRTHRSLTDTPKRRVGSFRTICQHETENLPAVSERASINWPIWRSNLTVRGTKSIEIGVEQHNQVKPIDLECSWEPIGHLGSIFEVFSIFLPNVDLGYKFHWTKIIKNAKNNAYLFAIKCLFFNSADSVNSGFLIDF